MEIIGTIFNELLYRPLFNLLVFFYNIIPGHDFGVAIILVTLSIRVILFPLSMKGIRSRKALESIQPKIKEIQNKYKDKEERARKMMEFYKENKINPASGCLPLLIQLPILIALYRAFINVINPESLSILYSFVGNPGQINSSFLGLIDLAVPSVILAVVAGVLQFIQSKLMFKSSPTPKTKSSDPKANIQKTMGKQMTYFMPFITVFIALRLPAGLPLYWAVTTLFGIGEYLLVHRKKQTT